MYKMHILEVEKKDCDLEKDIKLHKHLCEVHHMELEERKDELEL
jgi:hypothetical protein